MQNEIHTLDIAKALLPQALPGAPLVDARPAPVAPQLLERLLDPVQRRVVGPVAVLALDSADFYQLKRKKLIVNQKMSLEIMIIKIFLIFSYKKCYI